MQNECVFLLFWSLCRLFGLFLECQVLTYGQDQENNKWDAKIFGDGAQAAAELWACAIRNFLRPADPAALPKCGSSVCPLAKGLLSCLHSNKPGWIIINRCSYYHLFLCSYYHLFLCFDYYYYCFVSLFCYYYYYYYYNILFLCFVIIIIIVFFFVLLLLFVVLIIIIIVFSLFCYYCLLFWLLLLLLSIIIVFCSLFCYYCLLFVLIIIYYYCSFILF